MGQLGCQGGPQEGPGGQALAPRAAIGDLGDLLRDMQGGPGEEDREEEGGVTEGECRLRDRNQEGEARMTLCLRTKRGSMFVRAKVTKTCGPPPASLTTVATMRLRTSHPISQRRLRIHLRDVGPTA
jgi:hypothetical protein